MIRLTLFVVAIYLGWKIVKKTPFINVSEMDFVTGILEVEAHEVGLALKEPASRYERYAMSVPHRHTCGSAYSSHRFMDWLW